MDAFTLVFVGLLLTLPFVALRAQLGIR